MSEGGKEDNGLPEEGGGEGSRVTAKDNWDIYPLTLIILFCWLTKHKYGELAKVLFSDRPELDLWQ